MSPFQDFEFFRLSNKKHNLSMFRSTKLCHSEGIRGVLDNEVMKEVTKYGT